MNDDNQMSKFFIDMIDFFGFKHLEGFFSKEWVHNGGIASEYKFKDDFVKIYGKSGQADLNYCSEINEMEEILLKQQRITDSWITSVFLMIW